MTADALPWFLAPVLALAAGATALSPLGVQVLARGVVFIDLAVAQGAAAAALWLGAWDDHPSMLATQAAAAAGGLAVAAAVAVLVRRRPAQREALIGLLYVAGAAVAVLGARVDPHGHERLANLLAADVLWADGRAVAWLAAAALAVAVLARATPRGDAGSRWPDVLFYPTFALVASVAVPVLGLLVVFAALIVPALWHRSGLPAAAATVLSLAAAGLGLALSWLLDAPSGACVVITLGLVGLASAFVRSHEPARL